MMAKDMKVSKPGAKPSSSKQGSRSKALRGWITTVLGGIGLLYIRTDSLAVTTIGAAAALLATGLFLAFSRK
jgi:hypothetical protein